MSTSVDNKVFLGYCAGLVGLFSGGFLYNVISDTYQIKYKKSYAKLRLPYNLKDIKMSSFLNFGGIIGGVGGLICGYYGKPVLPLLLDNLNHKN